MRYKHLDIIVGLFVAVVIISNIGSSKIASVGPLVFDAGTLLFPLVYVFINIITEVYGFNTSKRVIIIGFISVLIMSITLLAIQFLPSADSWEHQSAYEVILGFVPRIVVASLVAYYIGGLINSFIMAKLKIMMDGSKLWVRTTASTIAGQAIDTLIFSIIAFIGVLQLSDLMILMATVYLFKITIEIALTPFIYRISDLLKKKEGIDTFNRNVKLRNVV